MSKQDNKDTKTPISAHPDPTTPNESKGTKDLKNVTAPGSAHPDPVDPKMTVFLRIQKATHQVIMQLSPTMMSRRLQQMKKMMVR